jgi:hypothetical protein
LITDPAGSTHNRRRGDQWLIQCLQDANRRIAPPGPSLDEITTARSQAHCHDSVQDASTSFNSNPFHSGLNQCNDRYEVSCLALGEPQFSSAGEQVDAGSSGEGHRTALQAAPLNRTEASGGRAVVLRESHCPSESTRPLRALPYSEALVHSALVDSAVVDPEHSRTRSTRPPPGPRQRNVPSTQCVRPPNVLVQLKALAYPESSPLTQLPVRVRVAAPLEPEQPPG